MSRLLCHVTIGSELIILYSSAYSYFHLRTHIRTKQRKSWAKRYLPFCENAQYETRRLKERERPIFELSSKPSLFHKAKPLFHKAKPYKAAFNSCICFKFNICLSRCVYSVYHVIHFNRDRFDTISEPILGQSIERNTHNEANSVLITLINAIIFCYVIIYL